MAKANTRNKEYLISFQIFLVFIRKLYTYLIAHRI